MDTPHLQTLRSQIKNSIHQYLLETVDFRKMKDSDLEPLTLRKKVEGWIRQFLRKNEAHHLFLEDLSFISELVDEAIGLGPIEPLLRNPEITEIMINGAHEIYVEKKGRIEKTPLSFSNEQTLRTALSRMVSPLGRRIDESSPMVDARLPDGSRVNAIIPPLVLNGPTITIRKFSPQPLSMQRLVDLQSLTSSAALFLEHVVQWKKNILIAGGTGSGKTTLLNALSGFIPSSERIITIEDAAELNLSQEHIISLEARPPNIEGKGAITIRDLVRNALRMRPDRMIVGECRGGEALDMLQAMNTGHEGSMTTIHANSPRDALFRLETMVLMSGFDLPLRAIREQIAHSIDLILFVSRQREGARQLTHITEICGTENDIIVTQDLFSRSRKDSSLKDCGRWPRFTNQLSPQQSKSLFEIFPPSKESLSYASSQ